MSKEIGDLGLTLNQTLEVSTLDSLLVAAWLAQVDDPHIVNPAAWFLTGVRSGVFPNQLSDQRRSRAVHLAERYIENAGLFIAGEDELLRELFGNVGLLRAYDEDELLRQRMVSLWREVRPRGEAVER